VFCCSFSVTQVIMFCYTLAYLISPFDLSLTIYVTFLASTYRYTLYIRLDKLFQQHTLYRDVNEIIPP